MFSKPDCGWITFTLGDFEAIPSYLTDVPMDCVDAIFCPPKVYPHQSIL
ncbi:hypothetical protein [Romboutsia maritimum]|nr:hypothetical protein [Romboutsia maritimum]